MFNFVFISPHFPPSYYMFCVRLSEIPNVNVLAVADVPYHELRQELKQSLKEYYRVSSLEDYDSVLRALGYLTHKYGKIDRIESHNEYWLDLDAALRLDFNVTGLKPSDMDYVKKKSRMKEVYQSAGLKVAKGMRVSNQEQAIAFCEENGYPVVIKPDVGVGAVATYKISEKADFEALAVKDGYFIEQFIEGKIVTFDGFADANSNVIFCQSHEYSTGVMEIALNNAHIYYYSYREIPQDLLEAGNKTVKAFRVSERFFHIEFFRKTSDSSLVCLEINFRPPGGYTMDMFNFALNTDLYKFYAEFITGNRTELKYSREYHVCYISRKNHVRYRYSHDEIMSSPFAPDIVFSSPLPLGLQLMGDFGYIYRHRDVEFIRKFTRFVWEKPDLNESLPSEWSLSPGPRRSRSNSAEKVSLEDIK